jgi:hypothetical protein
MGTGAVADDSTWKWLRLEWVRLNSHLNNLSKRLREENGGPLLCALEIEQTIASKEDTEPARVARALAAKVRDGEMRWSRRSEFQGHLEGLDLVVAIQQHTPKAEGGGNRSAPDAD